MRQPSRPERWQRATDQMREGLDELKALQEEYQDWMDNFPENAQSSATYEKLEAVCDLDLDELDSQIDDIMNIDLPKGFGRD